MLCRPASKQGKRLRNKLGTVGDLWTRKERSFMFLLGHGQGRWLDMRYLHFRRGLFCLRYSEVFSWKVRMEEMGYYQCQAITYDKIFVTGRLMQPS